MPSFSFIVPARSQRQETHQCLDSILNALRGNALEALAEFILIDDDSDAQHGLVGLFQGFRRATPQPVSITRFKKRQHYTGVFAHGLSRAVGDNVFFISNDMVVTPGWLRTVLAVAAIDPAYGIVRGTAEIVDSHPEHTIIPPFTARGPLDWLEFAEYMARSVGLLHTEDQLLSGDAVLIRRPLISRIGVMDRRFFGYFGDLDYGLRAQRAGFKLVCAKGAWLRHHGQGHVRAEAQQSNESMDQAHVRRMEMVQAAYVHFRQKWDLALPETYTHTGVFDFDRLRKAQRAKGFDFVEPVKDDPASLDVL